MQRSDQSSLSPRPATANILTTLLSQYELLTRLCGNLSSADIVHVGATSREHWQYVGHNPVIFKGLIAGSLCDGKSIVAQARVFGLWQSDPSKAKWKCRGKDAKPCYECGAMVCNAYRYHIEYPAQGPTSEQGIEDWDLELEVDEEGFSEDVISAHFPGADGARSLESVKAISMLSNKNQTYCDDCEPLLLRSPGPRGGCMYNIYDHFVVPWCCIPCILAEEARTFASKHNYDPEYLLWTPRYNAPGLCKCGKPERDNSIETCRWCRMIASYNRDRRADLLKRIQEQLGSWAGIDRSDDSILCQLG